MKNFVKLISSFSNISRQSQLIFVPGINDISDEALPK